MNKDDLKYIFGVLSDIYETIYSRLLWSIEILGTDNL